MAYRMIFVISERPWCHVILYGETRGNAVLAFHREVRVQGQVHNSVPWAGRNSWSHCG